MPAIKRRATDPGPGALMRSARSRAPDANRRSSEPQACTAAESAPPMALVQGGSQPGERQEPALPLSPSEPEDVSSSEPQGHADLLQREDRTLSLMERMDKAALIASGTIRAREAAQLATTSHRNHQGVGAYLPRLRVAEVLPALDEHLAQAATRARSSLAKSRLVDPDIPRQVMSDLIDLGHYADAQRSFALVSAQATPKERFWLDNHVFRPQLIDMHLRSGNLEAARLAAREAPRFHLSWVRIQLLMGDAAAADEAFQRGPRFGHQRDRDLVEAMIRHSRNDPQGARDLMETVVRESETALRAGQPVDCPAIAEAFAWMGDASAALHWLKKAIDGREGHLVARVVTSPFAQNIRNHALFAPLYGCAVQHAAAFAMPTAQDLHATWQGLSPDSEGGGGS